MQINRFIFYSSVLGRFTPSIWVSHTAVGLASSTTAKNLGKLFLYLLPSYAPAPSSDTFEVTAADTGKDTDTTTDTAATKGMDTENMPGAKR